MTTTIIADSLLPRPKLDCDGGYDVAVKGASAVVMRLLGSSEPPNVTNLTYTYGTYYKSLTLISLLPRCSTLLKFLSPSDHLVPSNLSIHMAKDLNSQ